MSEHTIDVNDTNFEAEVLKSGDPVLVDFWAEWCGPCKMIAPVIDDIAKTYSGRLKVVKVNIDNSPNTPRKYAVRGIPTLMLFKEGEVRETHVGAVGKAHLTQLIDRAL
ncbi:MAG TPA: thiol reductase thioredoxin [Xanthomonadales bacterium]|nr:thiol reductase thioredoxin [Xanthomonadales bacterium]